MAQDGLGLQREAELLLEELPLAEEPLPEEGGARLLGPGRRSRGSGRKVRYAYVAAALLAGAALLALSSGRLVGVQRAPVGGRERHGIEDVAVMSSEEGDQDPGHGEPGHVHHEAHDHDPGHGEPGHVHHEAHDHDPGHGEPGHVHHEAHDHHGHGEAGHHHKAHHKTHKKVPCGDKHKACAESHCCKTPGYQCYAKDKNKTWAVCQEECVPGPNVLDTEPVHWTCEALGKRTPGKAPEPNPSDIWMADWAKANCSGPSDDCSETRCCKTVGAQCFLKLPGWAACKGECIPGPDPIDLNPKPWACKALGSRSPGVPPAPGGNVAPWVAKKCAKGFDNCKDSRCCAEPGMQCFLKTQNFGMCMEHCLPGPLLSDADPVPWNCTAMGARTPGIARGGVLHKVAPWVKTKCSKAGEDCSNTMCCSEDTMQCYKKNDKWASCQRTCETGKQKGDKDGGKWSCEKLGPRTPKPWNTPSLYCIHVMMVHSYEAAIVKQEMEHNGGVGIFACELYDVYAQDAETYLGVGPLGRVRTRHFAPAYVGRSVDGTAGNSALFMNVWDAVRWVGNYRLTDWTIKADPDAVMIPFRLRNHLRGKPYKSYILNCNKPNLPGGAMMFGSVEAMSRDGIEAYFNSGMTCRKNFQYGEDRWLGDCFNELGVTPVQDFGMVGDGVCTGANCGDGKAAYHPFKNAGAWMNCYMQATR